MRRRHIVQALAVGALAGGGWTGAAFAQGAGGPKAGSRPGGRTIEASEFLRFDGAPDDAGLAALLKAAREAGAGVTVRFPGRRRVLRLSGQQAFVLPPSIRWAFDETRLRVDGGGTGNSVLMRFEADAEVLGLHVELATGAKWDRLIAFADRTLVDRMQVSSETQLANGDDNADGLVQVRGSEVEVVASSVSGVDRPFIVIGAGATATNSAELHGIKLRDLRLTRFLTGLRVRNVRDCEITGFRARERSSNASTKPGHNAILFGHVQRLVVRDFEIDDAGEHAIRVGGSPNQNEIQSRDILIERGRIRQPGKCGIKFWSGGADVELKRWFTSGVRIRQIDTVDCGFGSKLGVNENAIHLEAVEDFEIEGLRATADRTAASCHDVLFLAGVNRGRISGVQSRAAARSAVWLTQTIANTREAPVGSVTGDNIASVGHRGDFIHVDCPDQPAGPFVFTGLSATGGENFVGGNAPKLARGCRFEGATQGLRGALNTLRSETPAQIRSNGRIKA